MLQQDKPDDFVIATGETNTVRRCVEIAFDEAGLDWEPHVEIDAAVPAPGRGRPAGRRPVQGQARARLGAEDELRGADPPARMPQLLPAVRVGGACGLDREVDVLLVRLRDLGELLSLEGETEGTTCPSAA